MEDWCGAARAFAEYTERLTHVFEKNGTRGTWYAHASVGCLHVRPVLNLRLDKDKQAMRAIAEEAFAFVREYKGFTGRARRRLCAWNSTSRCSASAWCALSRR